jgi:hypothetical protein
LPADPSRTGSAPRSALLGMCCPRQTRPHNELVAISPSGEPRDSHVAAHGRGLRADERTLPSSMKSDQSAATSQPLANGVFALPRHLCHVLIAVRDGKQVVPGPRCGKPLCYSPCFLRSFAPKGFIHVRRLCHRIPFLLRQSLFSAPHPGDDVGDRCDGNTNVSAAVTTG